MADDKGEASLPPSGTATPKGKVKFLSVLEDKLSDNVVVLVPNNY